MPSPLLLTRVPDRASEARILAAWAEGIRVVPVLSEAGLPERLDHALSRAGVEFIWIDAAHAPPDSPAPDGAPGLLIVAPGVDAEVARLAAVISGASPLPLAAVRDAPTSAVSALFLVTPAQVPVSAVTAAMAVLAQRGVDSGLVYVLNPADARFAVLKALLVHELAWDGAYTVIAPDQPVFAHPDAPGAVRSRNDRERFEERVGVLLLEGHSTPIDANFGRDLVLCGRLGTPGDAPRTYPCVASGRCHRQPRMGRPAESLEGLMPIHRLDAPVFIFTACNVAAPGGSWFDPQAGLAVQAQQSSALAVVVTASMVGLRPEIDLFLLAMLAEGMSLGEVVRAVNAWRTDFTSQSVAMPRGAGPLLLLGNPRLRLRGPPVPQVEARLEEDGRITVDLSRVPRHPHRGAWVRADLGADLGAEQAPRFFSHLGTDFVVGLVRADADGRTRLRALVGPGAGALELVGFAADPEAPVHRAIDAANVQSAFWSIFMAGHVRLARSVGGDPRPFEEPLQGLPFATSDLAMASNILRSRPGVVASAETVRRMRTIALRQHALLAARCLAVSTEVAFRYGTVQSHGWDAHLARGAPSGPLAPCVCGGGEIWGQTYGFGAVRRDEYQCAACGPIGEDDGRRLLDWGDTPSRAAPLDVIHWRGHLTAPDDEVVHVVACLVLEDWMKERRMASENQEWWIPPATDCQIELEVPVPADLPAGTYPLAVLAVVNGALYIRRRMVWITPPAPVE